MVQALDKVTLKPIRVDGAACVLSLASSARNGATYIRQRFGSCGIAPTYARSLPTRICTATGGNPGATGGTTTTPVTPGQPSPVLPRSPIAESEQIPAGITRIKAASAAAGVFNTAGLPASQQVAVGVVDSGIDGTHPDLNLVGGSSWVTPSSRVAGDVVDADVDRYGHGTHVAGIIGARNNGAGVVGVAPGVALYSLKVLDGEGVGALSDAMEAVEWAASSEGRSKANIKVINLSLAAYMPPEDPDYQATLDLVCASFKAASDAGIVVVAAAGNYGTDLRGYLPASCPTVVAVTSIDPASNSASSFSNYLPADAPAADKARLIAAPGNAILSTVSYFREASGYRELSGTSMASPHVAGVAATCFMAGKCSSGSTGITQLAKLQAAAKERLGLSAGYGFAGDTASIINSKFYGNLLWAKF
ncbi:hypothetical protein OEZ85_003863 [Tetradesmus obliquus]|uniref:Peptidase S8/S53 domain-containing protein n=1 Tax=Tetradesmus obliquus TaxID=3088 RepID=A0ABY8UF05_TETOB|nr:hypothetical protein OEZ85_003863 [Tetradesmus obliquus]